jgi:flagellar basal body-associated protein FliL
MAREQPQKQEQEKTSAKGEFIVLAILGVFVVIAIIGMMVIDYYGTQRMGDPTRIHNAADR